MNGRNFHEVEGSENLLQNFLTLDSTHIVLAHKKHYWGVGNSACVLHVDFYHDQQQNSPQPGDLLKSLGFEADAEICPHLDNSRRNGRRGCYTLEVSEKFNPGEFINSFGVAYSRLIEASKEFDQCGISLFQKSQINGNGHTGESNELKDETEDDGLFYKLTLLEKDGEKSWTIHYCPKKPPLSPELQRVLIYTGAQEYKKCFPNGFNPCFWRSIPFEEDAPSKTKTLLQTHKDHFSFGIEKLIAANAEIGQIGLGPLKSP